MIETLAEYLLASRETDARLCGAPDAAWSRAGTHPTFGHLTLAGWLERMRFHLADHLSQILAWQEADRAGG